MAVVAVGGVVVVVVAPALNPKALPPVLAVGLVKVTSIPELLLWAVWLAWNKRRPVPTLVTRVFLVVSALWLLVIIRALGYALHYLN